MDYEEFYSLWKEPVTFEVDIIEAKYCRAYHKKGEKFQFSWNTPEGMCGEAFVGMYPVLVSLRLGGDMRLLGSEVKNETVYTCPSKVVKFKIRAVEQCNLCGKKESLGNCEVVVGERTRTVRLCPQCREKYGKR